jgi:hypothetical protein
MGVSQVYIGMIFVNCLIIVYDNWVLTQIYSCIPFWNIFALPPSVFRGIVHFVRLHVFMFLVPFWDVRYDSRVKRCSIHLYSQLFGREFIFYLCFFLNLFTHTGVHHDFHLRGCSCRLKLTRRMEQELITLPKYLSSPHYFAGFVLLNV